MGGNSSKESFRSTSSVRDQHQYQPGYSTPYYAPDNQQYYGNTAPPQMPPTTSTSSGYGGYTHEQKKRLDRRYSKIADDFASLDQVTEALARAGLESSNLIVGIDFTKSNEWTGAKSFNRKSLHHIGDGMNPYEQAISIIGKTLAAFDEDNLIPCFGFGDATTHDQAVFSFYPNDRVCYGFEEVLSQYREIVPHLRLAGPTSFAPVIETAMTIVEQSGGQYHVLLIIADGQVTRSVDTERGILSPQEQKTVDAIVAASKYPLSIVLVGVGDGPWDMMREFDDNIPARDFDNFQFVNFTDIMAKNTHHTRKETEFALSALMEIPSQYKATMELGLLGKRRGTCPEIVPLPPPLNNGRLSANSTSFNYSKPLHSTSVGSSQPVSYGNKSHAGTAPPDPGFSHDMGPGGTSSAYDNQMCPICFTNNKDMAFGCGHQTCAECGQDLQSCPICRSEIQTRIKLY
ncbi:E3 ubiquitin-protein ligase RGLG2-like [Silene latifolia]|uniref:E3 ubiquitin-protein ligase RGLG2-like n=1 Tax=Silene latifolia TaxID=37657 RepID=UPI003D771BA3